MKTKRFLDLRSFAFICGLFAVFAQAAEIDDPFRYLEDASDPQTQAYFAQQSAAARTALDAIPGRAKMLARIHALAASTTTITALEVTPARTFYLKQEPTRAQAVLCIRDGLAGAERELLDPARFDRNGVAASIDWYSPSPDGRHVAYGISHGGSLDSVLRVLAVDSRRDLPGEIPRARFNRQLAWHPDSRSFYYASYPEADEAGKRYAHIRLYRHVLGRDAANDEIVFAPGVGGARDVPEYVFPSIHAPVESRFAYAIAREGVRREITVHVTEQKDLGAGKPRWRRIVGPEDEVLAIEGWKEELYLLTYHKAPRHRVVRMKGNADFSSARVVVPEGDIVIQQMGLARDAIYLRTMLGGVDRLERAPLGLLGIKAPEFLRIPFDNAISQLVTDPRMPGATLRLQGYLEPPQVIQIDARSGDVRKTRIQPPPSVDLADLDEVRLYAPGHDGTRIPVTLVYRKSTTLTGRNPTLLVGFGAFGEMINPEFDPTRLAWLERGGVFAIAHVRGGGEYGEPWIQGGRRATKMNTVLDFISAASFLTSYGFTGPGYLAIQGTGVGAIPVAGAFARKPELFAAMVGRNPVADMLRYERMPMGPAQVPEFGFAAMGDGPEQLRAISAYHQIKDATPYPAVLLTAGAMDPDVDSWQAAKLAARIQAASTSGKPVLLRVDPAAGDGPGRARASREEELADIYSFLLWQMGDAEFRPQP
ncbi:MAG: prolyl oligopeptidase family serine peptidase [Usitatibacter sp.]